MKRGFRRCVWVSLTAFELERSAAAVAGDIAGRARLDVVAAPSGGGSELRLRSTLASRRWLLRGIARLAPPVARFGHDRLLDTGVRQFREWALDG